MKLDGAYTDDVKRLARAVDAIARKCWRGLPALLRQAPRPSAAQISDAFRAAGVDNDPALILGEWERIVQAVATVAAEFPDDWKLYRRFVFLKECGRSSWGSVGAVDKLIDENGISPFVVRETVRSIPRRIAALVSMT